MLTTHPLVLVTGATGKQGGAVARTLLLAGYRVRALTRTPSGPAAGQLHHAGAEIIRGDLDDPDSLQQALQHVQCVFSVQNFWEKGVGFEGEFRQGRNLAEAARAAQVQHYVQSTMAHAAQDDTVAHFASKRAVEQLIETIGLPSTLLGTVYFMDNLLDPATGGAMTFPVLSGGLGPRTTFHLLATQDLGPVTAAIFADPARFVGHRLDVAGDVLTVPAMKAVYRRVSGRRPQPYSLPSWLLRRLNPEFAAQLAWHRRGGWTFDASQARAVYPGMTTFESFLRRHAITNL